MGTITARKSKDGSTRYTAQIRIKANKKLIHTESRTFSEKSMAKSWLKSREVELEAPGAIKAAQAGDPTLAEVIDQYIRESKKKPGRTKSQVLNTIKGSELGELRCSQIDSPAINKYGQTLGLKVKPQTVSNYFSHLATVMKVANPLWGYPLNFQAMEDARVASKQIGRIGRSGNRTRRPSLDELNLLMDHFTTYELKNSQKKTFLPMRELVLFAIFSTRREAEIFRIKWEDLNEATSSVMVRDMKNPGETIGNDVSVELPPRALKIIRKRMTEGCKGAIFPYNGKSVGSNFRNACRVLGIDNLHFHDLRHEGVSCLFELGKSIPLAASVSGHRSWTSLKRYTHIRQSGDKYANWSWLDKFGLE